MGMIDDQETLQLRKSCASVLSFACRGDGRSSLL
jgi:hypothetical protein